LPDPPGLQAAKGNPGRRKSAVQKRLEEAERVAQLLAQAPDAGDPLAVPGVIGANAAPAIAVWKDLAPRLAKTHRLQPHHRPMFALFCVYFAEWVLANEDVQAKGHTQRVKTVAGGYMERVRPIVAIRDRAFDMVMKLSERFGLTPSDEYSLFKDQALAAAQNPGLFDSGQTKPSAEAGTPVPPPSGGLIGAMSRFDSAPPTRPN
ncbi:P27 family phage terminase small subunit, partial [Bradyrhizobium sp.]|uniref:P27 family phage terminase small subunit n=1 Tax=Bradyrhizobium sp. TaxID=376 RepID=UPI0025C6BB98